MDMLLLAGLLFLLLRHKQAADNIPKPVLDLISIVKTVGDIIRVVVLSRFPAIEKTIALLTSGMEAVAAVIAKILAYVGPPLAWAWLLCLVLTLADVFTPLEIANPYLHSAAHSGTWLLVFFAAQRFGWAYTWPVRLWLVSIVAMAVSAVLALWPLGLPFAFYVASFFAPVQPWQTTYIYFRRAESAVVDQHHAWNRGHHRRVLLRPVAFLFQWAEFLPYRPYNQPPKKSAGSGWEVVDLSLTDSKLRVTEQKLVQQKQEYERCYQALYRRDDSLIRVGQQPEPVLPSVTQQGANTLGLRLQSTVWATRSCCQKPEPCPVSAVTATWKKAQRPKKVDFTLMASPCISHTCQSIYLVVCGIDGPGTYSLGEYDAATRTINGSFLRLSDSGGIYLSKPALRVTITRFDTVARVVAGTFEGTVASRAENAPELAVQQGRFDVHFEESLSP